MNKKCAAFVLWGRFWSIFTIKNTQNQPLHCKRSKGPHSLNDIMVAAKMLTSRVWCQSVTKWVKMAIMCNLLVNWDKLLKMTNHYVITWKSSPICDQSKSDHDLLVPSCAITLLLKVVSQRLRVLPCRHCSYLQTVSECKKGHCNFSVTVSVKPTMIIWLW